MTTCHKHFLCSTICRQSVYCRLIWHLQWTQNNCELRWPLQVRHVGGRGRQQDDSIWGERTQYFPCIIRCENRFRLQKYRNGGQLWVVNILSYTIHAQTDSSPSCFPLALSIFFPLLLWRFPSSQLFCVHLTDNAWLNASCTTRNYFDAK
jgi:hypothetical protein